MFGEELGGLLWKEAEREESFISSNLSIDGTHMYQCTPQNYMDPSMLRESRRNEREIKSNIPKLVKILMSQKDKREKFEKEFAQQIKNSDLKNFLAQYEEMRKLWNIHLTTSKEEVESVKKQTEELTIRTEALEKTVTKK